MNKTLSTLMLAACTAVSGAALAQSTSQTNLDPAAAAKERRNATPSQLAPVSNEQARANALRRCDNLPEFYKVDCVARVNGQGTSEGSVIGGGILHETRTEVPLSTLQNAPRVEIPPPRPMPMPAPRRP